MGVYFYFKEKALSELLAKTCKEQQDKLHRKVILREIIFIIVALLIGITILSAVSSRVFEEGFAVFG